MEIGGATIGVSLAAGEEAAVLFSSLIARKMAERDAELFEVAIVEIGEHIQINLIIAKLFLVLIQAATAKPLADVHSHAPNGLESSK